MKNPEIIAAMRRARLATWISVMAIRRESSRMTVAAVSDLLMPYEAAALRKAAKDLDDSANRLIKDVQVLNEFFEPDDNVHADYDKWIAERGILA